MVEEQEMITIGKGELLERVTSLRSSGYRLVQICPTTLVDRYEMNYSFARDLHFTNLRFTIFPGDAIPSISLVYWNAFLYENEIHDLFGITVENMTVDYQGKLYRTSVPAPFSVEQIEPPAKAGQPGSSKAARTGEKKSGPGGSNGP